MTANIKQMSIDKERSGLIKYCVKYSRQYAMREIKNELTHIQNKRTSANVLLRYTIHIQLPKQKLLLKPLRHRMTI